MPIRDQKSLGLSPAAHALLTTVQQQLETEKGRKVSFSEVIEILVSEHDSREAGR
jgi:hypothetical protein